MSVKQHSPMMRHISGTHRVDLDWLLKRISKDSCIFKVDVPMKELIVDIMRKGSFIADVRSVLCKLCVIRPVSSFM